MQEKRTIKLENLERSTDKELWIETNGDDLVIDYFRNYKNLDQPYHAQMTVSKSEAIILALSLIAACGEEVLSGGNFTLNKRESDKTFKDTEQG